MSVPGEELQNQSRGVQQPPRWPLLAHLSPRSNNLLTDARLINCYAELIPGTRDYQVYKRYGVSSTTLLPAVGAGFGCWLQEDSGFLLQASQGHLGYFNFGNTTSGSTTMTGAPIQRYLSFCSLLNQPTFVGNTVLITDTAQAWIWDAGTLTTTVVSYANFPTGVVPGIVYLDATVYVMDLFGNIRGSNVGDVTTWNPLNTIRASSNPDQGSVIFKQLTYLVALKTTSGQVFYDAGNSPGSPLAPLPDAQLPYGCLSGQLVQVIDDIAFWVTINKTASPQVVQMAQLSPAIISTPAVDRLLSTIALTGSGTPHFPGGSSFSAWSWSFKLAGHRFFGITSVAANLTLVYDVDQREWYIWTDANGNYWPYLAFSYVPAYVNGVGFAVQPRIFVQNLDGSVRQLDTCYNQPTDLGLVIPVDIYTPNIDFGTVRAKTLHAMYFNADKQGSFLNVRHSDDDYQTWTTFRQVNLQAPKPQISDEGTFPWRRAYHFRHHSPTPFRMSTCDLQLDIGTL